MMKNKLVVNSFSVLSPYISVRKLTCQGRGHELGQLFKLHFGTVSLSLCIKYMISSSNMIIVVFFITSVKQLHPEYFSDFLMTSLSSNSSQTLPSHRSENILMLKKYTVISDLHIPFVVKMGADKSENVYLRAQLFLRGRK